MRKWFLSAPFIYDEQDLWLARFVPKGEYSFSSIPAHYRHDRTRPTTGMRAWSDYVRHGSAVWQASTEYGAPTGIVSCFPQLAATIGLRKRTSFAAIPIVAWNFNLGALPEGARKHLARFALAAVDRFVVHSRAEIPVYSQWLALPRERFRFVPLQRTIRNLEFHEDEEHPFVLSMGSAHRDFRLLFDVLDTLKYDAVVVAGKRLVANLKAPSNVRVLSGLSIERCHELVQRARINVIPVANQTTASGQVTFLDAMMYGRPTIVTRCPASVDYVTDGADGLLVSEGDADDMRGALQSLWHDRSRRDALGNAARRKVIDQFSDVPVAALLADVLGEFDFQPIGH